MDRGRRQGHVLTTEAVGIEDLLRTLAPQVVGALTRKYRDFDTAEDAVQEAMIIALERWPRDGIPTEPAAWMITTASRRLIDRWRSDLARRDREQLHGQVAEPAGEVPDSDDTLTLLFLCCHPSLTPASAIALTLRAVGGLTTDEIARAFLVPSATMGQRISPGQEQDQERRCHVLDAGAGGAVGAAVHPSSGCSI